MKAVRPPLIAADRRAGFKALDWPLLASTAFLLLSGLVSLASVGVREHQNFVRRQELMAAVGLIPFAVFFLVSPDWWRRWAKALYVLNLGMLVGVLAFGSSTNGAQRWIDLKFMQFQPSEMAKLLTILTLAAYLFSRREKMDRLSTFLGSFVHVAVPALLIARQPHYGGAMVLIVVWLCLCIVGQAPMKFVLGAVLILGALGVSATQIPGLLHDYHLKRIQAMQVEDKQGASYQQDRAEIAIGAGGITGAGLLRGSQRLPEQENDFVFTAPAEDLGLVGGTIILIAFAFFFYRVWLVMLGSTDGYYRMIVAGILGMLAFHTLVNLAMVLKLCPVVGLWLPFMSAGGTALWLCMASVGLVLKIRMKERPILF